MFTKTQTHYFSNIYSMFTFVKNYRQIFMAGVMNNFNFTPESVDKNPDGYLKADDFRKMPEAENHALQRMLMQGGVSRDSIKEILEDPRKGLSIQQLIDAKILPERRGIVNSTRRAEQAHREEVSNQSRETVGSGQLVWPIPNKQEAMRIQAMIGTKVDGDFGPNSRRALQVFLKNQGLYTGAIDGIIGNGTAAAMNAFNRGVAGRGVTQRTERVSSHPFRTLENFLKRGGNSRNLEGIDRYIDARNTELNSLAEQITNAKQSRNPSAIAQAHAATLSALQGKIPAEMYTALANAQGPVEQTRVLDYVSNSLMGGRNTVEIAQGRETAREYAGELRRLRAKTESVLRSEGLSSQFIAQSNAQVQAAMNHIANATTFSSGRV